MTEIFDKYRGPKDVRKMAFADLEKFAKEIRRFLIEKVSKTGGHLASNLGVVELTLSLYKVFNFDYDKIVWDVGHQSYVHKILTGRREGFDNLRKYGGISGFPKREESPYDMFETGHSSTSISAALGMARARDLQKKDYDVISVIGDGALTGGMAFEALNDVGYRKTKVIIILNDNQMSIASNVGGLSKYLSKIRLDPKYNKFKEGLDTKLRRIPNIGKGMANSIEKLKDSIKQLIVPGMLFEEMGIKYLGPIDGHNIKELTKVLSMAKNIKGPVLIHVITVKGKGYNFAEKNPGKFHGIGPFDCDSGEVCFDGGETYSRAFGEEMIRLAEDNSNIVAITAAMRDGTGLKNFSQKFGDRFFDVGISEQHAVTLAAGMASEGLKPVFAVYSTFLQRAYDQVLHDVCIQNLPVILAIDRAGIVGEDGETHQGVFDLSFLSHMPNITIMSPKCVDELKTMLRWAVEEKYPIAIRYPRGGDNSKMDLEPMQNFTKGKWEIIYGRMSNNNDKNKIAIIASGRMVQQSFLAKDKIEVLNAEVLIVNACFIKPIDKQLIEELITNNYKIVTLEDNVVHGGFGSFVLEYVNNLNNENRVLCLGFGDKFITHGSVELLYKLFRLDADGIAESISKLLN